MITMQDDQTNCEDFPVNQHRLFVFRGKRATILLSVSSATLVVIFWLIYFALRSKFRYWKRKNVPYMKFDLKFIRNSIYSYYPFRLKQAVFIFDYIYRNCPNEKCVGVFLLHKPQLFVKDLETLQAIMCGKFSHFRDKGFNLYLSWDFGTHSLIYLNYERWKPLRKAVTPLFSAGAVKSTFDLIKRYTGANLLRGLSAIENEDVQINRFIDRYMTDVACAYVFGVKSDCLNDPNDKFRIFLSALCNPNGRFATILMLKFFVPSFLKAFRIPLYRNDVKDQCVQAVKEVLSSIQSNEQRPLSILDLFISERITSNPELDVSAEFLATQCFTLYLAGSETSSNTTSYCLMELAQQPNIQMKIQREIDKALQSSADGQITYHVLEQCKYLDLVIAETLRMYPPVYATNRTCTADFTIPESDIKIEKGMQIIIPIYSIHRDPRYYNNPELFNPDNFSPEAIAGRPSKAYIPFGEGPRNCIGKLYGLLQVKWTLATILHEYNIIVSDKMKFPVLFAPFLITIKPNSDIWLKLTKRLHR